MAPLAKNIHDVENCAASVQQSMSFQLAAPASAWSCAAPTVLSPRSSFSSNSSSHSSTSSIGSSSSSSTTSSLSSNGKASLTVLHNVGGACRALLLVLERNGVAHASIRELQTMILGERYLEAMQRAEDYVDCLLSVHLELDSIILLFVAAWEALRDYSKVVFKDAQKDYSRCENQHFIEFIELQTLSEYEQNRRQRRQLEEDNPQLRKELKQKLWTATRFKIDCEKGLIQTAEWSRYLRAQQRLLQQRQQQKQ